MYEQPQSKAWEIQAIIYALESELQRLDALGAGIAAIHVNAAIEQLRSNLAIVNDNSLGAFDPSMLCQVKDRTGSSPQSKSHSRD
ncbi:hypothetical protein FIU90_09755 [Erythrobacter sp. THAF29]|nr:hypothetical protein FIU90_09755 [Erythrobacter sp. THAF29]